MNSTIKACQEAAKMLVEIRQNKFPPVPLSCFTLEQFMEQQQCGITCARNAMKTLLDEGKIESQRWAVMGSDGRTCYRTIYRKKTICRS